MACSRSFLTPKIGDYLENTCSIFFLHSSLHGCLFLAVFAVHKPFGGIIIYCASLAVPS